MNILLIGLMLGQAGFLVKRTQATGTDVHLARLAFVINGRTLDIQPEHSVGPAFGVAYIVSEARTSSTKVTFTGHRAPFTRDSSNTKIVHTLRRSTFAVGYLPTNA